MKTNQQPEFFASLTEALATYQLVNVDVQPSDEIALIRKTSARTGRKIWAVVGRNEGVNCTFEDADMIGIWWEDSYDQDYVEEEAMA